MISCPVPRSLNSIECSKIASLASRRAATAATSDSLSSLSSPIFKFFTNFERHRSSKARRNCSNIGVAVNTGGAKLSVLAGEIKKDAHGGGEDDTIPITTCGFLSKDSIANVVAGVGPAVVKLAVPCGIGSGAIFDRNGFILTCAHVVVDYQGMGALSEGKVDVTLQDGQAFEGTVLHADLDKDIAIVKINSETPLPIAKLGSSSKLRCGELVVAMGCPHSLQNTVTFGIVSYVGRKSSNLLLRGMPGEYIQTDCSINAGNSGGPLVNLDGEVVGVNVMKVINAEGLSFAVPIDSVSKIIEHFKKSGVGLPWLGLTKLDVDNGVIVPTVTPGSSADRAGFHPGDVILEFDGKPIANIKEIIEIMGDRIGVSLKVVVKRANDDTLAILTVIPEKANPDM